MTTLSFSWSNLSNQALPPALRNDFLATTVWLLSRASGISHGLPKQRTRVV